MNMDTDLLTGIIDELQRKEDCADNILQLLQAKGLDHLPLDTDVLVEKLKNSLPSETLNMIFAKDKVNSLKVLLPPKLSTHFAADLFMKGYRMNAKNCMMYLLSQVPTIIHANVHVNEYHKPTLLKFALDEDTYIRFMDQNIHTSNQERVQLLNMFLEENSSTGKTLLEQATTAGCVGETMWTLYTHSRTLEQSGHMFHTTEALTKRYKEEVRIYRNQYGESLLHTLLISYWPNCPEDIISSTKQLLSVGIDPTSQDNRGRTVLDKLILRIFVRERMPEHLTDIPQYIKRIEACLECLQILVLWCTGTHGEFNIPKLRANYPSYEALSQDLIKLWYVLLNSDILHVSHANNEYHFACLVANRFLGYDSLCQSAAELLYYAMCKGLNFCNPEETKHFSLPYKIIDTICYSSLINRTLRCACSDDRPAGELKPSCNCCHWSLLELVLNMKPELVKPDNMDSKNSIYHHIYRYINIVIESRYGGPIDIENITKMVNITWMYFPPSRPLIIKKLHALEKASTDTTSQRVIQELQEQVQTVRPLQLLTRLCILQNIQWKHIQQLPLPGLLKRYIEIGDVSSNHVIHQLNYKQFL